MAQPPPNPGAFRLRCPTPPGGGGVEELNAGRKCGGVYHGPARAL